MRVVHVDSATGWRGGQNQVLLTARGMAARGHGVVVACQRGGVLEGRARAAGLDVRPLVFRGDLWPGAAFGLARVVRDAGPDIVQAHDPHALSAAVIARGVLGARAPLIATRRVDFPVRSALSRRKYHRTSRIIAVSQAIARVLEVDGFAPSDVRVVHEGVPDRPAETGGREALRALGVPAGARVVGNVAALTDHKDHETLLAAAADACARVPNAWFVIVGDGELREPLVARARTLGLDRCVFAGFRTDLDRLIPAFDVFCLSSHMEGLGTSLLDAMAFGRAVVATRAGGIPEAVEDGVTGRVVEPRDPRALAEALVAVLTDDAARSAYGAAGRGRFLERFTAERMVEGTLAAYEGIR
jgi:glycosyltransferase involved in cell wall biosynthesis